MMSEIYVKLAVVSEKLNYLQIGEAIGIVGNKVWKRGDLRKPSQIIEKNYGLEIHSEKSKTANLNEHLNALMEKILPYSDKIKELSNDNYVELSCAIYGKEGSMPEIHFDKKIISFLNKLGVELDIDLYVL